MKLKPVPKLSSDSIANTTNHSSGKSLPTLNLGDHSTLVSKSVMSSQNTKLAPAKAEVDDFSAIRQVEKINEIKHLSRSLWFTKLVVSCPCLVMLICMLVLFTTTLVVYVTGTSDINSAYYRDFLVWDDKRTINWDMKRLAVNELETDYEGDQPLRTVSEGYYKLFLVFEGKHC